MLLVCALTGKADESSTADLAKAAQNPLASMISLPFQNNTNTNYGPEEKTQNILNIQPVWPIEWNDNWNFITRTIIPVESRPGMMAGDSRKNGIGDISFTGFFSPKESGKWIWGAGPVALLPTGSDDLTQDKWGLGPSAVVLTMNGPWVYGGLISNIWSVSGSGTSDINLMTLQPFINYNLPGGRYLTSSPVITANWEKDSGERWIVPMGLGYGKIFKLGKAPVNGQISLYRNVEVPTNGSDWQLRLQLQFMFPK
ncbi:MAG TPA: neuromedin U [Gammaproteobacteria bacterium]|nr:neuromedin U [Gammaproteobacteria bacterium]